MKNYIRKSLILGTLLTTNTIHSDYLKDAVDAQYRADFNYAMKHSDYPIKRADQLEKQFKKIRDAHKKDIATLRAKLEKYSDYDRIKAENARAKVALKRCEHKVTTLNKVLEEED